MSTPQEIVELALASSTSRGCVVLVRSQSIANLRWARNTLTTNGETRATAVSVVAIVDVPGGVAAGSVTLNHPSPSALADLVRRAEAVAVAEGPADDAAELASGIDASAGWADPPEVATSADLGGLAGEIGELFAAGRADGIEHFGYAEQSVTTYYLGTSTGLRLRFADPEGRLELTAKSHGRSRSAWSGRAGRSLTGMDLVDVDRELRQGLAWQATRIDVGPGRHAAVLTPSAVADLMIELYWSSVARDAADGQSVWSHAGGGTRAGELVADARVTLHSDPALRGLEAVPFVVATGSSGASSVFDNGLPVEAVSWIRAGVLENLITTRHTAAETGLPFRPGVENLRLDVAGASGTLEDVVARTGDGLVVTCLWYNRVVDPQTLLLTGLTRDGVYAVRGGEVVGAVTNFRFNDSPVGALARIEDAGATVSTLAREMGDYFNRAAMPPLVVRDFNFSTVSQAS
jgi:predicted Zn-dependent protease